MSDTVRIYFDISALQDALDEAIADGTVEEGTILDIVSFKIYESTSKDGTFILIDTVDYNPQLSYVETDLATDETQWFKISYLDSLAEESELSDPVLGEKADQIIYDVALALGDTNRLEEQDMAFTDSEYLKKIKESIRYHSGSKKLSQLEEADISMIIILVRISCCYDLAYDNAKYIKLNLPEGVSLDRGARVNQYLKIASQLEKRYLTMKKTWTSDIAGEEGTLVGTPVIETADFVRKPVFKNLSRLEQNRRY